MMWDPLISPQFCGSVKFVGPSMLSEDETKNQVVDLNVIFVFKL